MKYSVLIFTIVAFIFSSCNEKKAQITVNNNSDVELSGKSVVVKRQYIERQYGELPEAKMVWLQEENGDRILAQLDDMDEDSKWDELFTQVDLGARQSKSFTIVFADSSSFADIEFLTNLRLGIKQDDGSFKEYDSYKALSCDDEFKVIAQGESVTCENDKIAFRNYFDCRNAKDLFGKRMRKMIIDDINSPEMGSYHVLADWGMDVLHCGSSLGAGGIAMLKNDSLYRLGAFDDYRYQKIVEGPLRSIFELRYKGWDVDGELLDAVERISIYSGKYWFESDVTVNGSPEGTQIVTGIVTSHLKDKDKPFVFNVSEFKCAGTYGVQSMNEDELGMAVLLPKSEAGKIGQTTDINFYKLGYKTIPQKKFSNVISETFYVGQEFEKNKPAKHFFFAVWGLDLDRWKTKKGFTDYISEEAEILNANIEVL